MKSICLAVALLVGAVHPSQVFQTPMDNQTQLIAHSCEANIERLKSTENSLAKFKSVHQSGQTYYDPTFTHNKDALYWSDFLSNDPDLRFMRQVNKWMTPAQIDDKRKPKLYGDAEYPHPEGVNQQMIGSCWFLAAAAALAEQPDQIKINIEEVNRNEDWNSAGIFRFYWYDRGNLIGINVDSALPVIAHPGYHPTPLGCRKSENNAWWMALMEKAFAKFYVNYDHIQGGLEPEALRMFTNKPVFNFRHRNEEKDVNRAWKKFHDLATRENPSIMGCCRKRAPNGLVGGHAYTMLGTVEVSDASATYRLVKIRNPWAREKYKGPWSDESSLWTDDLKKQAGWRKRNDGVFFMPFDLYIDRVDATAFAIYHKYNYEHYWSFKQTAKRQEYKIHNPTDQKFFVTIETQSPRLKPDNCIPKALLNIHFFNEAGERVQEHNQPGVIYSNIYHYTTGSNPEWTTVMPKGTYTLQIVNWSHSKVPSLDYILQVYQDKTDKITVDGREGIKFSTEGKVKQEEPKDDTEGPTPQDPKKPTPPANSCNKGRQSSITTYVKRKDVLVTEGMKGTWQKFHQASETFACGMRQRTQKEAGADGDASSLNQIQFKYCKWCEWDAQQESKPLGQTENGEWGQWTMCPKDHYITAIQMKEQEKDTEYKGDDTAAHGAIMRCRPMWQKGDWENFDSKFVDNMDYRKPYQISDYSKEVMYGYVCGGQVRSEPDQKCGDDSAFNGLKLDLCSLVIKL